MDDMVLRLLVLTVTEILSVAAVMVVVMMNEDFGLY